MGSMRYLLSAVLCCAVLALPGPADGFDLSQLPKLGDAGTTGLSREDERRIGRTMVSQLRESGALIEDPEIEHYVRTVGQRLVAHSDRPEEQFEFFVVNDTSINAFAMPGGYVGVNLGLILATDTEAELAGVMAHEVAHVTQRHIARRIEDSQGSNLAALGGMLAAVLVGVQTGQADVTAAGAMSAQALALRRQLQFSRAHEHEADRIGIRMMARAGYDPQGMVDFFETLDRRYRHSGGDSVPEYLQTHPLTSTRITEARSRAREMSFDARTPSRNYYLTRTRLNARTTNPEIRELISLVPSRMPENAALTDQLDRYGRALRHYYQGRSNEAVDILKELVDESPDMVAYHRALADALRASGEEDQSREHLARALRLFPDNVALLESYGSALLAAGQPQDAYEVYGRILDSNDAKPRHLRHRARAANDAGNIADSHFYLARYHFEQRNLPLAMSQIRLAQTHPAAQFGRMDRYNRLAEDIWSAWERTPDRERQAQRRR